MISVIVVLYIIGILFLLLLGATYLLPLLVGAVVIAFQIAWVLLCAVLWGLWLVVCCLWFPFDPARARAAMRMDQDSILLSPGKRYRHEPGPPLPSIVKAKVEHRGSVTAAGQRRHAKRGTVRR